MKNRQEIAIDLYRTCYSEFLYHENYLEVADILIKRIKENEEKYQKREVCYHVNSENTPVGTWCSDCKQFIVP